MHILCKYYIIIKYRAEALKLEHEEENAVKEILGLIILLVGAILVFGISERTGAEEDNAEKIDIEQLISEQAAEVPEFSITDRKYLKHGFGEEYYIYQFENTDLVVFYFGGDTYYLGKYVEGDEGPLISTIIRNSCQFIGFSQKYMLFKTPDEELIAKEIVESQKIVEEKIQFFHKEVPFEELTEEEQRSFIYPIACEKISSVIQI